ncbi:S-formylglutathione hydrolase [Pseudidiomarina sp. 1APR75-15]|uniref:S-formylglutathione hydrolase n=1 Tax=Pseudidiomarina terrestris TaxID=2820060 RepID=A0ABT8MEB0_9GAMM|nr:MULTISPECIES: S-formylglutathione hydrolase [unclassified Pseudidiomarina]MDN7128277.1 S-formylglutathione hydrolase [Pseudidiomarina sp. 1APR75-15]MDN7139004.1 S-formylglutathione hydrolase [Pseudidiomarina sp. 1ASP75-14]MEA3586767.1 S-formylglutathione hydrolase [Pseudidiomarina sp. 1APP75-27a]
MTPANLKLVSSVRCFNGEQRRYEHVSQTLNCTMQFSVYLPPQALRKDRVASVLWLSGLTCNDENFSSKAGAQRVAAQLGLALIIPDTSPRGEQVADDDAYDFGKGAGFYVNATQQPWAKHYQMYDYISKELLNLVTDALPLNGQMSISGHSMGGHGALVMALRETGRFASVSAFAPIAHPTECPWGHKAFTGYLGSDRELWREYDAVELIRDGKKCPPLLVDQGGADNFLAEQLNFTTLQEAAEKHDLIAQLRLQEGYDHSYYFIASFIEDHLNFHKTYLKS